MPRHHFGFSASRGFGRHKDFDHCSVSRNPKSRNRGFGTFGGLRRSEIALLATEIQDFRWLRYPCFRPVSHRNRRFFHSEKTALGKNQFSQPWRGRFTCLNSRLTSTDPNISSGVFIFHLELGKAVKSPPQKPLLKRAPIES
jgi:hypothetical protein